MHIPSSMDDEFTVELYCKIHKCTALQNPDEPIALVWKAAWQMYLVDTKFIVCRNKTEYNGECWIMMLTDANRYAHGPNCYGVIVGNELPDRTANPNRAVVS